MAFAALLLAICAPHESGVTHPCKDWSALPVNAAYWSEECKWHVMSSERGLTDVQVIGSHLHTSATPTPAEVDKWDEYLERATSDSSSAAGADEIQQICMPSYEDLPVFLKRCFVSFAMFQRAARIPVYTLVAMIMSWEVVPRHDAYARALQCIERLQHACLIEETAVTGEDAALVYHMHDILRDLAVRIAQAELGRSIQPSHEVGYRFLAFQVCHDPRRLVM